MAGSQRGKASLTSLAADDFEYLEFYKDKAHSDERFGKSPGVPPGILSHEDACSKCNPNEVIADGLNNSYYQSFLKGYQGHLGVHLVRLFRQHDDLALELFMKSHHLENKDWYQMTDPNRYLWEHFHWWIKDVRILAQQRAGYQV